MNYPTTSVNAPAVQSVSPVAQPTSPVQPITVSSTRADVHASRLDGDRHPVIVVVHHRMLGLNGVEAVELHRALAAVLDDCNWCGQKCHGRFCADADCERLYRGSETAIREGYESRPVEFAHTGRAAA